MNDNEPKKGAVKKFIIKHRTGLTIAACTLTSAVLSGGIFYVIGSIDQRNADVRILDKQLGRAMKVLDDDTMIAFIDAFEGVSQTSSK